MAGIIRTFTKRVIIIGNVTVSICMLLLYVLPYTNQRHAWMINLFALVFPFLLLLQTGFLIFWLMIKQRMAWIPVSTFLLCWSLVTNFFGFHVKGATVTKPGDAFRVATFNSHLFNFFENKGSIDPVMIEKIKALNADVFAAQEFVFSLDSSSPSSLERTRQKLGYKYVVTANDRAFGVHTFTKQNTAKYHPFCVAIFSNYPILRWQKVQSLKEYNHTFLWADILLRNDTVRVFNLHLQSMHFARDDYKFIENINDQQMNEMKRAGVKIIRKMKVAYLLRAAQAQEVKAEILKSPYPVIVCGDMNDVPNSYTYQTISNHLKDAFAEKGRGVGRTFKFLSPTLRIDYIFHSKELELKQVQVVKQSVSDHRPVVADFQLK